VNTQAILSLTISRNDSRCRIAAQSGTVQREIEIDMLPESFRQGLIPLQEAILRSAAARASSPIHSLRAVSTALEGTDKARTPMRDAPAAVATHGDDKIVQEMGSRPVLDAVG
jgi:hypothetical protein